MRCHRSGYRRPFSDDRRRPKSPSVVTIVWLALFAQSQIIGSLFQTDVPQVDHAWKQRRESLEERGRKIFVQ